MALASGTRLGPYQILDPLGMGGMGEVYRARDTRLERIVAVKVLPPRFVNSAEQRARFEWEARAVSTLSHPRICTLYDVGEEEGAPFLVMEHLTGETLASHLRKGPLPIVRALRIGVEIAEGLAAAHKHGIVHRDLKPSNVMLTPTGVKLLDFGLAKLNELGPTPAQRSLVTTMATPVEPLTAEGVIVGSRPYMAPEQLEGKPTDARTDLWALGVILYEMLTGRRAFSADSSVGLTAAILEREPQSLASLRPDTPPALERIVVRCLAKDPDTRWFSAHDVASELAWVAQTSGATTPVPKPRPPWRTWLRRALLAGLVLMAGLAGAVVARWVPALQRLQSAAMSDESRGGVSATGLVVTRPRQVTSSPGWETSPAISPDGSLIAYVSDESGNPDIWIVGVGGTNALRLTTHPGNEDKPCWYPDGRSIAFVSGRNGVNAIWKVPVLGGNPTLLLPDADDPAIDAAGGRIAFVRSERIAIANLASPTEVTVLTREDDGLWNHRDPAWSPDGRMIAYAAQRGLWVVPAAGGRARPLTTDEEADEEPVWSSDGRFVYFKSHREGSEAVWRVAASGGTPQRLTLGNGPEGHPSLSRDGRNLAFTTFTPNPDIVVRDLATGAEGTIPNPRAEYMPTFSHDGRTLMFVSDRGGQLRIWQQPIANGRMAGPAQTLTEHHGAYPVYSPDGHWVAYYRVGKGQPRTLWIVPRAGGEPVRLTHATAHELYPAWSARGTELAFVSEHDRASQIVLAPIRDGRAAGPTRVLVSGDSRYESPAWSPDGRFLAFIAVADNGTRRVWIVQSESPGSARPITSVGAYLRVKWHPRARAVLVSTQVGDHLEVLQVDPERGSTRPMPLPVRLSHNPELSDFDISRDGAWLTFCREAPFGDIWMAEMVTP
jgi:eukaryotic-like serine/threonine-protein kinase